MTLIRRRNQFFKRSNSGYNVSSNPVLKKNSWSPTSIPDCIFFCANEFETVQTGSLTKVNKWIDLSGNNNHFSQSNNSVKPQFIEKNINFNGQPTLHFLGAQSLETNILSGYDNISFYMVYTPLSLGGVGIMLETGIGGVFAAARGLQLQYSTAKPAVYTYGGSGAADLIVLQADDTVGKKTHMVVNYFYSTAASTIPTVYVSGTLAPTTTTQDNATNTTFSGKINLGGRNVSGAGGVFNHMACFIGYSKTLSQDEINKLYEWSVRIYGPQG